MGKSHSNCCVVGCRHTYANSSGISFYAFPGKPWEFKRKVLWMKAVRRKNPDGSPWIPSKYDRVCSAHFVGGKVSNIEHHPAYVPSIFPDVYDSTDKMNANPSGHQGLKRKRKISPDPVRSTLKEKEIWKTKLPGSSLEIVMTVDDDDEEGDAPSQSPEESASLYRPRNRSAVSVHSVSTQVAFNLTRSTFEFSSALLSGSLLTQCNLVETQFSIQKDAASNTEVKYCGEFLNFERSHLPNETQLELTGVPAAAFSELLSFLTSRKSDSIATLGTEKALLLFLSKMRLGLSFTSLSTFLNVPLPLTRKVFFSILDVLSMETREYVTWVSKRQVLRSLPRQLRDSISGTRALVELLQLSAETPTLLQDRRSMYSTSKSTCAFKFLLAVSPNGQITFKSHCYEGMCEDSFIYEDSGFLQLMEEDDLILTKTSPNIVPTQGRIEVLPSLVQEVCEEKCRSPLSSMRARLDQTVRHLGTFQILNYIPRDMFGYVDNIVHMACVLTNMGSTVEI